MLGSVETLVMEGRAAGRFLASGASPEHAISLSIPRPPPHVQLWGRQGDYSLVWEVRAAFREVPGRGCSCPSHPTEDPSLPPLLCFSRPEILLHTVAFIGLFGSPQSR